MLAALNSSSKITRSLLRKPTIDVTSHPISWSFFATGYAIAQPTPPPTTATFLRPSVSVAFPRGPTKSWTYSPTLSELRISVPAPTIWKIIVTVPFLIPFTTPFEFTVAIDLLFDDQVTSLLEASFGRTSVISLIDDPTATSLSPVIAIAVTFLVVFLLISPAY